MRKPLLPPSARESFLEFVRAQTRACRADDRAPPSRDAWQAQKKSLRERLAHAYGDFPAEPCELAPRTLGVLERDGYRIERLVFQSRPGVWITANTYVPAREAPCPGVLSVHGHWPWARVDPVPHARALGLVKLGYFVLAVDAFGAGERAIAPAQGTYHGAILGASTWPVGTPLLGLQIYDNMRAADYLASRAEVDANRLAITGASGGGNQTMNAGAWDERFKAVVPVCSVGTYDAYLGAACCVCEVLPGALGFAEEGAILALVAPRALMVVSATRDAHQFSVAEAAKSIARARPVFDLYEAGDRLRHVIVDSGHAYNQPMREAMYGWLAYCLRGEGDGTPVPEPEIEPEEVNALRCFPDNDRPKSFLLPPEFVREQALRKLRAVREADHRERWEADALVLRLQLENRVFGGFPRQARRTVDPVEKSAGEDTSSESFVLYPEPGMPVPGVLVRPLERSGPLPTAVLADPAGKEAALATRAAHALLGAGWQLLALDLRGTGETAPPHDAIAGAPDHNSAEWSVWMGRPLLGQWCWDILSAVDHVAARADVDAHQIALVGTGAAALAAVCAGALEERVRSVTAFGMLASFVSAEPFQGHRMATFVPRLLDAGDVPRLAALLAPRRLLVVGPVDAQSRPLNDQDCSAAFRLTEHIYKMCQAEHQFQVTPELAETVLGDAVRG